MKEKLTKLYNGTYSYTKKISEEELMAPVYKMVEAAIRESGLENPNVFLKCGKKVARVHINYIKSDTNEKDLRSGEGTIR